MKRASWPLAALFTTLVFGTGVFCGLLLNSTPPYLASLFPSAGQEHLALPTAVSPVPPVPDQKTQAEPPADIALPQPVTAPEHPEGGKKAPHETADGRKPQKEHPVVPFSESSQKADPLTEGSSSDQAQQMFSGAPAVPQKRDPLPFAPSLSSLTWHKLGSGKGPTLLIVGGIQGDEPGGFSAASLIASQYTITDGSVWVVPGLNLRSILQRNRGIFGDLNRKFAAIDPDDPEFGLVAQIKNIILRQEVSLVLNLHDGSGFFRPVYENTLCNPARWGQSLIIDQEQTMTSPAFDLYGLAKEVEADVNQTLLEPLHRYYIHNTRTGEGNVEMAKTLSWFAVQNGKPAFGIEASKEFGTEKRVYYHLQVIEAFMRRLGITYTRDFPLDPKGVLAALNSNLKVAAYNNRLVLDLENVRPSLHMVPFKKNEIPEVRATKPLLTLVPDSMPNCWRAAYGNRTLTRVNPAFMDFDDTLDSVEMILDGKTRSVRLGEIVSVDTSFLVKSEPGYRVNAIGAQKEKNGNEADVMLLRKDFMSRFSVDKNATVYRVEVYKDKAFSGMILVRFGDQGGRTDDGALTARGGSESDLGF